MAIIITVTSTFGGFFTTPSNFGSLVTIEAIAAGGNGSTAATAITGGGGGGGGAQSYISALPGLIPNKVYTVQVGIAGGTTGAGTAPTANSWFDSGTTLLALGGATPSGATGGLGGSSSGCVGTTIYSGGNGGDGVLGGGGGGGGGSGFFGIGLNGGNGGSALGGGGGGGGAAAGSAGNNAVNGGVSGATGGNGPTGTGGGAGGFAAGAAGSSGSTDYGGGGGGAGNVTPGGGVIGGNGGAAYLAGGGGGGSGDEVTTNGGNGGSATFGGGGGGYGSNGGAGAGAKGNSGTGGSGVINFTYNPIAPLPDPFRTPILRTSNTKSYQSLAYTPAKTQNSPNNNFAEQSYYSKYAYPLATPPKMTKSGIGPEQQQVLAWNTTTPLTIVHVRWLAPWSTPTIKKVLPWGTQYPSATIPPFVTTPFNKGYIIA